MNQAEILIHAFKHYYLKRASWKSQEEFQTHVLASWPEYNHRHAHPFEWTWTNQKMRQWFAKHAPQFIAGFVSGDTSCLTLILACIVYWQAREIFRVISQADPASNGLDLSLLEHISPIEWDNIVLYGEYICQSTKSWPGASR